ncbi:MAG: exopolyphosphatase [Microthrixaceae bacterium]
MSGASGARALYGAIDCGTNSTRLLISDGEHHEVREMHITRLGAGVDRSGVLDPEAIQRTLVVLAGYADQLDQHRVAGLRIAATSAVRDASNSELFLGPVSDLLGTGPEILTGEQEAELSFRGATASLPADRGPYLVVDIGGGSTEFAVGAGTVAGTRSTQMGCVRMTEKYLAHDPPLPEELTNCLSEVEFHVDGVRRAVPMAASATTLVGLAGTVSTVAAVELGLATYDRDAIHHFRLSKEAAEDVFRTLATEAIEDRVHNPGLEAERADVIVGGCCVLVGVMRYLGYRECLVSEADILDGLVLSQIGGS